MTSGSEAPGNGDLPRQLTADVVSERLASQPSRAVARELEQVQPEVAGAILEQLRPADRLLVLGAAAPDIARQWVYAAEYPAGTIGSLMDPPLAVYLADRRVEQVVAELRELVRVAFITYLFVIDSEGRLIGVVAMRELLLAEPVQTLGTIMVREPFTLSPTVPLLDAMRRVLNRHFPVYPVCDDNQLLVGSVRGQALFEQEAIEISAQPGQMVGVEKQEHVATTWFRSLLSRHPWLQLNLLTAFAAAAVVGTFQSTIDEIVLLAVFLPVLAGQCGNTGAQALAVTLRGVTLGEVHEHSKRWLFRKEALLGALNGGLVGLTAALAMFLFASLQDRTDALLLALVVLMAMTAGCTVAGLAGALVPLLLRRLGKDPATASSIFLSTATDVVSMGLFLALANWILL